jgi:hypothetical protein
LSRKELVEEFFTCDPVRGDGSARRAHLRHGRSLRRL